VAEMVEVLVGVIGRAHGIRGEVAVDPRTDEPERRFADGQRLRAEDSGRIFTVVDARDHSGRLLVRFAELEDRTVAESVRGTRLVVDVPADEQPDDDGEYYDRQLVGLQAQSPEGGRLGEVTSVLHLPFQDMLEITTPDGVRLVPFVEALVPSVDLAAGRLTVVDVVGLMSEVDEPGETDAGS
jgi:16S rRNA processing protein RimM